MSPVKWLTDGEYESAHVSEKAVAWADSFVGQREVGRNAGAFVTKILAAVGLGPGYAWCAAFVSFVLRKAGFHGGPTKGRARVKAWVDWAFDKELIHPNPKRGDLFYWLNNDGTGHIGFVISERNFEGRFKTIEGNTNPEGSREGDGVYKRSRVGSTIKFIRWWA